MDMEKIIHDLEFENQQCMREIEKEDHLMKVIYQAIDAVKKEIIAEDEITPGLDEDCKTCHRQFVTNRESIESIKRTLTLLDAHEKTVEKKAKEAEEYHQREEAQKVGILNEFKKMWDRYNAQYETFDCVKKLRKLEALKVEKLASLKHAENETTKAKSLLNDAAVRLDTFAAFSEENRFIVEIAKRAIDIKGKELGLEDSRLKCGQLNKKIEKLLLERQNERIRLMKEKEEREKVAARNEQIKRQHEQATSMNRRPVGNIMSNITPSGNKPLPTFFTPAISRPQCQKTLMMPKTAVINKLTNVDPPMFEISKSKSASSKLVLPVLNQPERPKNRLLPKIPSMAAQPAPIIHKQAPEVNAEHQKHKQVEATGPVTAKKSSPVKSTEGGNRQEKASVEQITKAYNLNTPVSTPMEIETSTYDSMQTYEKRFSSAGDIQRTKLIEQDDINYLISTTQSPKTPTSKLAPPAGQTTQSPLHIEKKLAEMKMLAEKSPGAGFVFSSRSMFDGVDESGDRDSNHVRSESNSFFDNFMSGMGGGDSMMPTEKQGNFFGVSSPNSRECFSNESTPNKGTSFSSFNFLSMDTSNDDNGQGSPGFGFGVSTPGIGGSGLNLFGGGDDTTHTSEATDSPGGFSFSFGGSGSTESPVSKNFLF